jgi:nucleoside-diphosphate-sugar epimerase
MNPTTQQTCVVSGTGGYLGSRVKAALLAGGWKVVELTRRPQPGANAIAFQLGEDVSAAALAGAKAVVHCAYDFKPLSWAAIQATNVAGSEKLLRAARQAGIQRSIYISSISAFDGCRSLYGKAKLETEALAHSLGAMVIRPGLIWGDPPAGMFGRLVHQVENARVLPLFGGGSQIQYLVHDQDLSRFVRRCAEGEFRLPSPTTPVTVAHEQPWTFRQILEEIARSTGKRITFLPFPWRLLWAGLKTLETCHVAMNFRSDSLLSLMYQNPNPSFAAQRELGLVCRPFHLQKTEVR